MQITGSNTSVNKHEVSLPRSCYPYDRQTISNNCHEVFSEEVQEKMAELEEVKEYMESQKNPKDRKEVVKILYFIKCIREWY